MVALLLVFVIPQFLFLPTGESTLEVFWALRIGELFLPVTAIVVYANIFSKEWEWRTAPLWQSRSFSRVTLVGTKWLIATAFLFAIYFVFSLYLTLTYVSFDWIEMLLTVFPPGLFLGTLGMFVGAVSRRSALAFVTPPDLVVLRDDYQRRIHRDSVPVFADLRTVFAGTGSVYRTQPTLALGDLKGDVSRSVADAGGALDVSPSKPATDCFQDIRNSTPNQQSLGTVTVFDDVDQLECPSFHMKENGNLTRLRVGRIRLVDGGLGVEL